MADSGSTCAAIIKDKNLIQISDSVSLDNIAAEVIGENPKTVEAYKKGKDNALMFLVGQVMKKTAGRANPKVVQDILKRRMADA
jgi:aspartyl-tRNA(Asn)/glutamyl-tRNA(Gln) amidotransferase subunit B